MRKRRRRELLTGIFISIFLSLIYTAFGVKLITLIIEDPLEPKIVPIVLVALSIPAFYWGTYLFSVQSPRRALKHGVVLTDDTLSISTMDIPVNSILRVEVADFHSGTHFLAIGYLDNKGKGRRTKAILLWPKSTEDILELCNAIRNMKGWTLQEDIMVYGHWAWSQWKDKLKGIVRGASVER